MSFFIDPHRRPSGRQRSGWSGQTGSEGGDRRVGGRENWPECKTNGKNEFFKKIIKSNQNNFWIYAKPHYKHMKCNWSVSL